MKNLFVPYALAVLLKEKGFNDECLRCYEGNSLQAFKEFRKIAYTTGLIENDNLTGNLIAAPLYLQAVDWLREEKKIAIGVEFNQFDAKPLYTIKWHNGICHNEMHIPIDINRAIEEALKLIP